MARRSQPARSWRACAIAVCVRMCEMLVQPVVQTQLIPGAVMAGWHTLSLWSRRVSTMFIYACHDEAWARCSCKACSATQRSLVQCYHPGLACLCGCNAMGPCLLCGERPAHGQAGLGGDEGNCYDEEAASHTALRCQEPFLGPRHSLLGPPPVPHLVSALSNHDFAAMHSIFYSQLVLCIHCHI